MKTYLLHLLPYIKQWVNSNATAIDGMMGTYNYSFNQYQVEPLYQHSSQDFIEDCEDAGNEILDDDSELLFNSNHI